MGWKLIGRRKCGPYLAALKDPESNGGILLAVSDSSDRETPITTVFLLPLRRVVLTVADSTVRLPIVRLIYENGLTRRVIVALPQGEYDRTVACLNSELQE